jgi:hypothetical protein
VIAAARLDPARQRAVLALMGVDVYAPRGPAPLKAVGVLGDRDDPLVAAVVRALGLDPEAVAWGHAKAAKTLVFGATGAAPANAVHLPSLERLRADGKAKREAWRALRGLARERTEA